MDRRPTHQWPSWRECLLALACAGRGLRPRLARSRLYHVPGDRPPQLEDFTRLRAVLHGAKIDDERLQALTALAGRRIKLTPELRPHRLRLVRHLQDHELIPRPVQLGHATFEPIAADGAPGATMTTACIID